MTNSTFCSRFCLILISLFLSGFYSGYVSAQDDPPQGKAQNLLRMKIVGGTSADEMIIYFDKKASDGFDASFDAIKMMAGIEGAPNLYSLADSIMVSINVMGAFNADKVVPLEIISTKNTQYTLSVEEILYFDPTSMIFLEDRQLGKFFDLRSDTIFKYNFPVSVIKNRFFVHFKVPVEISTVDETCKENDGIIKFNNPSDNPWDLKLLSKDGFTELASAKDILGEHYFVGLKGGDYKLNVTKSNSGYSQNLYTSIKPPLILDASFSKPADPVKTGLPVQFSANQVIESFTYNWDMGDGTILTGPHTIEHIYANPGVYTVTLLIGDGICTDAVQQSVFVQQDEITGISIPSATAQSCFEIFPNPVNDMLSIQLNEKQKTVEWVRITDLQGRLVFNEYVAGLLLPDQTLTFPLGHLPAGSYFLSLSANSEIAAKQFLIKR